MAITSRQSASGDGNDVTVTFGLTPNVGSLLIVQAFERSGMGAGGMSISGSGWTKEIALDNEITDSANRWSMSVWYKVAGASEPTAITITTTGSTAVGVLARELDPDAGETFTYQEETTVRHVTTPATFYALPNTTALAGGELCVVCYGARVGSGAMTGMALGEEINSNLMDAGNTANSRYVAQGFEVTAGAGAVNGDWSQSGGTNNTGGGGAMLVFTTGGDQIIAVGLNTETDSALAMTASKPIIASVNIVSETDSPLSMTALKAALLGITEETDSVFGITAVKPQVVSVGQASESDLAQVVEALKPITVALGISLEEDSALIVTPSLGSGHDIAVGLVVESDTALSVAAVKPIIQAVGLASETDLAFSVTNPDADVPAGTHRRVIHIRFGIW